MEWTALRDFVSVAQTGSLSRSARALGLSQPTLGRRIAQLERQLHAQLFKRTTRGLTLTELGERILAYAQRMADEATAIEQVASGADQQLHGSVRITLTDLLGLYWLPEKLPQFYERFPGLRLEAVIDNRSLDLMRREADIAVRFGRPRQLDLVTRRATAVSYGLYASSAYLDVRGRPAHLRDLRHHDFISYDESITQNADLKRLEQLVGADRVVHRSNSNGGVLAAVRQGIGLGVLGCYVAGREPGLERLFSRQLAHRLDSWVITHADTFRSARVKSVFEFLVEKLTDDAALFCPDGEE
jgi:DNA-binding transcriptional LysR family regulator